MTLLLYVHTWARCRREIFTEALLLASAFFFDYLKISTAKDVSTALSEGVERVLVAETIPLVSS